MMSNIFSGSEALFALLGIFVSYVLFKFKRNEESYHNFDLQYNDILNASLDNPEMRDYKKIRQFNLDSDDKLIGQYNIYAYMCWNYVETIFDKSNKESNQMMKTWQPVIMEEYRLHYRWFNRNRRLFKEDFRVYVDSLNKFEIKEGTKKDLKIVYTSLKKEFDACELKSYEHLESLMETKKYKLLLAEHESFGTLGYALTYDLGDAIWLDYMVIDESYRHAGFGKLFFNKIIEYYQSEKYLGMFLEVEIPEEPDQGKKQIQQRRIRFYEDLKAKKLNIDYKLPTNDYGFNMFLYYKSFSEMENIPVDKIEKAIETAFNGIHSDVKEGIRQEILENIKNSNRKNVRVLEFLKK